MHATDGSLFWAPLAWLYGLGVAVRHAAYDVGLLPTTWAPVQTISVGGIEAGGSGKTPVVAFVLQQLLAAGRRPGLLSRGYGRLHRHGVVRMPGENCCAQTLGDEPAMLLRRFDIAAAIGKQRSLGASALVRAGCDVLLLDDGWSHRALGRHLDIVVLRGGSPLGNGYLLPRGTLREPAQRLGRAHLLWMHYDDDAPDHCLLPQMAHWAKEIPMVVSRAVPTQPTDLKGNPVVLKGKRVLGIAGICYPKRFYKSLQQVGAQVIDFMPFADHHAYDDNDRQCIIDRAVTLGAEAVVMTPKDAVKWSQKPTKVPLWQMGSDVAIVSSQKTVVTALKPAGV